MEPTLQPEPLDPGYLAKLAHHLQDSLQQENATQFETLQLQTVPLQIHCVLKGMTLMVLAQHPARQQPGPEQVFPTLERAVRTLPPELMAGIFDPKLLPCRIQVKLYLRSRGQQQPHALHAFTFVPVFISSPDFLLSLDESEPESEPEDSTFAGATLAASNLDASNLDASNLDASRLDDTDGQPDLEPPFDLVLNRPAAAADPAADHPLARTIFNSPEDDLEAHLQEHSQAHLADDPQAHLEDHPADYPAADLEDHPAEHPAADLDAVGPAADREDASPSASAAEPVVQPESRPESTPADIAFSQAPPTGGFSYQAEDDEAPIPWLAIGWVGGLAALLSSAWVLTRPCVLDTCQPLQTARRFSQEFIQTAQTAQSTADLKRAQAKLLDLNRQLEQVPRWSGRFADAQTLGLQSQAQVAEVDAILAALDKAAQASRGRDAGRVPNAAEAATEQALWQAAIAQLSTIPNSSPLYDFAQSKLTEFQDNLDNFNRQSLSQGQIRQKLAAAKSTAQKAQERQKTAQTQADWQLTKSTWLTAIKALQEIPPTAEPDPEVPQLLLTYQAQVMIVGDRLAQIQQSRQAYAQTLAIADRARILEQQNQWTAAVATWREALQRAQQIPPHVPDVAQVQTLIPAYTTALKQAEGNLQSALAQQRIQTDLAKVCAGSPQICSFAIAPDTIRLQLTPTYEQALGNAFAIGQSTDPGTYGQTVIHINTLQTALQTICNNAGRPLEVYNARGSEVVGSFNPQR